MTRLALLGEGLDAIIQHTTYPAASWLSGLVFGRIDDAHLPIAPTPEHRLARYQTAVLTFAAARPDFDRRLVRGAQLQHQWACHGFLRRPSPNVITFPRRRRAGAA